MNIHDSPAEKTIAKNEAGIRSEADRYWQTAGDRVLLYLRCLNFPAPQALELALGALKAAERSMDRDSVNGPVAEAMQALHELLSEQKPAGFDHNHCLAAWYECVIPPAPAIHRLPMVPEGMESAHWLSLLKDLLIRFKDSRSRKGTEDGARVSP
jgi:hypothetical protein